MKILHGKCSVGGQDSGRDVFEFVEMLEEGRVEIPTPSMYK